eukprot:CAMPEP_0201687636 /NCGR_PEP_ID=MMETSP0578-20130828/1607_1 /ASSEMBLY_ACC=CAM_ASM_000663 /TAXON_ID=267565 /ORGANISM="Skeletonema grethea, Strain CCMP 1804" /LENGTH=698 /DNA_ID=CAMNT_0048171805 /DNA_START=59 /DNA_END=2152 /DNA_ORIENTATION=-
MKRHFSSISALLGLASINTHTYASAAAYHTSNSDDLPPANAAAARPAPLKGFLTSPEWHTGGYANPQYYNDPESTMEFYYIGLSDVMTGMTSFPGFDTVVEPRIAASASRGKHAILRFYMDYPRPAGSYVSHTPQFLIDDYNLQMTPWSSVDLNAVGSSPDYSDENLKTALANFAAALGNRYDGDNRVGYIQVGLLGFWGEWHTWTEDPATHSWIPDATKTALIDAFDAAFETTQIQIRYPHWYAVGANQRQGLGLHDDSFAHSTIDEGVYGAPMSWFFWSQVQASAATDFWMSGAMGGEVRPELQATIFDDNYAAGTQYKQDFGLCAETTHATYMLDYYAFATSYSGNALASARAASDQMGYAFRLAEVSVAEGSDGGTVDITASVIQDGIAPFYYDLSLELSCPDGYSGTVGGVDDIVSEGSTASFTFTAVPATSTCLSSLGFSLSSSYALAGASVKFAQGVSDGEVVEVSLPLPPTSPPTPQPTSVVTSSPTKNPTPLPTFSPTSPPTTLPTELPTAQPTPIPSAPPTALPTAQPTSTPSEPPTAMPTSPPTHAPTPMEPITPSPTNNPTTPPTTSPVVAHKTIVCGRGDIEDKPCAEGLKDTAPIDEMHEVRCCRDCTGINCKKPWKRKCATFDSDLYARSKVSGVCKVGTFAEAVDFCRNSANDDSSRLCTPLEVENSCAKGTGCNFDKEQVW